MTILNRWNDHFERMEANRLVPICRQEETKRKETIGTTAQEMRTKLVFLIHRIEIKAIRWILYGLIYLIEDDDEEEHIVLNVTRVVSRTERLWIERK